MVGKKTSQETTITSAQVDDTNDYVRGARGSTSNWKIRMYEIYLYVSTKMGGGGGSGDIKSDGSVNFFATETWGAGTNQTQVATTGFSAQATVALTGATLNNDGLLTLKDDGSKNSQSIFRTIRLEIGTAAVRSLNTTKVTSVAARANYVAEVVSAMSYWHGGTTPYDGVGTLYFRTQGRTEAQFQINAPQTIDGEMQNGVPITPSVKSNLNVNKLIEVYTDNDSTVGDSNLTIFLMIKETKIS